MNSAKLFLPLAALFLLAECALAAQAPYLFRMTFRGTAYQTNTTGQVVATPLTETNLLLAAAQAGGSSDISGLALAYHIAGAPAYGDTIEVYDLNARRTVRVMFGLFFGDNSPDPNVGRTALANSQGSQMRRVDYVYMFDHTEYTYPNSHSMGACFTTKRFLTDTAGNVHTTVNGDMQWIVNPNNGAGTKVCAGSFTTGRPLQ